MAVAAALLHGVESAAYTEAADADAEDAAAEAAACAYNAARTESNCCVAASMSVVGRSCMNGTASADRSPKLKLSSQILSGRATIGGEVTHEA